MLRPVSMHLVFLTPFPDPPGGGSAFNAGLVPALRDRGFEVTVAHGPPGSLPPGTVPVVDGMLLPALEPGFDALLAHDPVVVVHHAAAAAGRDAGSRDAVRAAEARMLPRVRRVIATSAAVAERLRTGMGVAAPIVLQPGLPVLPRNPAAANPCRILCAGVLTPRKGHERLLRPLVRLLDLDWSLVIAGDAERDPAHAQAVAALVDDLALASRVSILRNPDPAALESAWREATLFALASSWEAWPAGIAEALRRGVPVVAQECGGVGALVPAAAGIVCAPEDEPTWGKCLRRAIYDADLRAALADGAWTAGCALPGWPEQAATFDAILRS